MNAPDSLGSVCEEVFLRHNMPFQLKPILHTSASGLRDFMSCEAKHGFARNCIGVPELPQPVAAVFGIVFHFFAQWLGEKFWKIARAKGRLPYHEGKKYHKVARSFLLRVLAEQTGPRNFADKVPVRIRWFSPRRQSLLSDAEYRDAVKEATDQMVGRLYNAIEAYRLEFTNPNRNTGMVFEKGFSGSNIALRPPFDDGPSIKVDGFIDWIRFFSSSRYVYYDFKTGWVVSEYTKRVNVVEDIQMTIYDYAGRKIFGQPPSQMFIQPMEFATAFLREHGSAAMSKKRILIPPRTDAHFADLELLARDVFQAANLVAEAYKYTQSQLDDWTEESAYGRKAGFAENVRQLRYIPRIGPACEGCKYIGLCQSVNEEDWKAYAKATGSEDSEPVSDPFLVLPESKPALTDNRLIFDLVPKRSVYVSKTKKQMKSQMLETGDFVPIKTLQQTKTRPTIMGMVPFFNRLLEWTRALGPCPCVELNLFPIHLAQHLRELYFGKISLAQVLSQCPCEGCPRKKKEEDLVS